MPDATTGSALVMGLDSEKLEQTNVGYGESKRQQQVVW